MITTPTSLYPLLKSTTHLYRQTSFLILFLVATYGRFYGLGISFLLLATFRLLGLDHIKQVNGLKVLLMSCSTIAATVMFVLTGVVDWNQVLFIMVGLTIGGYAGAYYARMLDPNLMRSLIIITSFDMTGYFFIHT